ncbi:helix-turn-helix domain-containing protein [Saccharopolyspora phatthalungensis]|uniref:Transcriptional regulator with XRE-family HTH domain n=1 Tax=Saccharopolyspora phatthalungensis TaxID=664693 RepID=A0A840QF04_9PSEU|nr:helix-turn-helix transcriptional regulator [Saccharopolyspora phatthalungensis]MBB5158470.1 transcriptional regulator with XRE-family HTH domain [Saccharopolyspora phatthalungensis]
MGDTAGTPRTRVLAAALRGALAESGFTARQAARLLDKSHSTISQWQNGRRVPVPEDVSALLAILRVTGRRRHQILDLAKSASEPNWLAAGAGVSDRLAGILECERTTVEIFDWCPLIISGLVQTSEYANAVIGSNDTLSRAEISSRVNLRLDRRNQLVNRDGHPADHLLLVGEAALRQRIGGNDVLVEQLRHLVAVSREAGMTLQVVPLGDNWHPGLMGPFVIYNFAESPSIVSIEHHKSSVFLHENDDVMTYKRAAGEIRRAAISPEESTAFILDAIKQMEGKE